jgi:hypothetical protein
MWLGKHKRGDDPRKRPYVMAIMPRDGWTMSERQRHRTDSLDPRELSTEEALDIESDRRRRVVAAFLLGGEARPDRPTLRPWRGVVGGVGLTAAAIVVVGVVAVASATVAAGGSATPTPPPAAAIPSVTSSAAVSVAATPTLRASSGPIPTAGRP